MAHITTVGKTCSHSFTQFCFDDDIAGVFLNKGIMQIRQCEHPVVTFVKDCYRCRRCGEKVETLTVEEVVV